MKGAATLVGGAALAIAAVRLLALQPEPVRLALELQDYAALPITADNVISLRQPPSADTHGDLPQLGLEARAWAEMLELLRRDGSP